MDIKKISIIGLGLIGGSLAKAFRNSEYNFEISAYDMPEILSQALTDKSIDLALNKIDDALAADIIFLCLPVQSSIEIFGNISPRLKPDQILTDVCGVKKVFDDIWKNSKSLGIYIGGHPMTGKEIGGYKNSDPLLFENSVYILSDTNKDNSAIKDFLELIKITGAKRIFLSPLLHDKIVASVSHLPQLLSIALVNNSAITEDEINFLDFAAGGFRDMTRIASSNFDIWESIIKENKFKILESINSFQIELNQINSFLENDEFGSISAKFEEARIKRDEIPKNTKGFLTPLHDIFVFVSDVPGVISKISTSLFNNNINIKDIELLKIREGTGGTFRLSFESDTDAKKAERMLQEIGYKIKI